MSTIAWPAIQAAFHAWAAAGSGLSGGSVRWADQEMGRPAYPFVTLEITGVERTAIMTRYYEAVDETFMQVQGGRALVTVTVQAFSSSELPASTARSYLDDIHADLFSETRQDALSAANIGFGDLKNQVSLTETVEGVRISRWAADFTFFVSANIMPVAANYIDNLEITGTITGIGDDPQVVGVTVELP